LPCCHRRKIFFVTAIPELFCKNFSCLIIDTIHWMLRPAAGGFSSGQELAPGLCSLGHCPQAAAYCAHYDIMPLQGLDYFPIKNLIDK
jgi:hypothetical protein